MRLIPISAAQALAAGELVLVQLVELELSETLYLASSNVDIDWAGHTYRGMGLLGAVEAVEDVPSESKALRFTLSGLTPEAIGIALAEDIRNRPARLRLAVLDRESHAVIDAQPVWSGSCDQMPIVLSKETCTVSVTAEHRGATFGHPKPFAYTDGDQQRVYPGDTSLRFLVAQANHQDVWPAAGYFKQ